MDLQGHCLVYNPPTSSRDKIGGKIQDGGKMQDGGKIQDGGQIQDGAQIEDSGNIQDSEQIQDSSPSGTVEENTKIINLQSEHSYPLLKEKITEVSSI